MSVAPRPVPYGPARYKYQVVKSVALKNEQNLLVANLLPNSFILVEKLWVLGPSQVLAQVVEPSKGLVPVATLAGEPLIRRVDQHGPAVPEEHLTIQSQPAPQTRQQMWGQPPPNQMYRPGPGRQANQFAPQPFRPPPGRVLPPAGRGYGRGGLRQRSASAAPALAADPRRNSLPALRWNPQQQIMRQPLAGQGLPGTLGGQPMLIGGVNPMMNVHGQPRRPAPGPGLRPQRPRTGSLLAGQFGLGLVPTAGPGPVPAQPQALRRTYSNTGMPLRLMNEPYQPVAPAMPGPPMQQVKLPPRAAQQPVDLPQRQIHPHLRRRALSAAAIPNPYPRQQQLGGVGGRPEEGEEHTPEWLRAALAKTDPARQDPNAAPAGPDVKVVAPAGAARPAARTTRDDSGIAPRPGHQNRQRRRSLVQRLFGVFRSSDREVHRAGVGQSKDDTFINRSTGARDEVPVSRVEDQGEERAAPEAEQKDQETAGQTEIKRVPSEPMTEEARRKDAFEKGKEWRYDPERWVLVSALCHALETMCYVDKNRKKKRKALLTKFHADTIPQIPLAAYLKRIAWFSECSKACFVLTLEYIYRLKKYKPEVNINHHAVHQLVITCIMVSAKFFDDKFFNNSFYARVGGLPAAMISRLELQLLFFLNFDLHVLPEDFEHRYKDMVKSNEESPGCVNIGPEGHWKTAVGADFENYPPQLPEESPSPPPAYESASLADQVKDEDQERDTDVEDSVTNREPGADDESADAGSENKDPPGEERVSQSPSRSPAEENIDATEK